ncbi:MAG: anti-sigma factor family protein [Pyrinomonadaceae bacterium]
MRNIKEASSCLFGEELIAYIYGELPMSSHAAFEKHLLDCSGCTEEFADISVSRLGVFEWHRDEFLPLETPQFVIPFEPKAPTASQPYSWFDAVRNLVASPMRLVAAGGSLAIITFAVAFGVLNYSNSNENQVASGVSNVGIETAKPNNVVALESDPIKLVLPKKAENTVVKRAATSREPSHIVRTKADVSKDVPVVQASKATTISVPRLGNFVETEDTSLRLADLVADIDTMDRK